MFNQNHFDIITNISGLLAIEYFCNACCSTFHHKTAYDTHSCLDCETNDANTTKKVANSQLAKDYGHFLKSLYTKGSSQEVLAKGLAILSVAPPGGNGIT